MFADQMHFFIEGLDAVGVGPGIVRKFDFLTGAHVLGAPVKICHVNGNVGGAGNQVIAGFPAFDRFAAAFQGNGQVESSPVFHFVDDALDHGSGVGTVGRDTAHLADDAPQGPEEEFLLDHHPCPRPVELPVEQVGNDEIPDGCMRNAQQDATLFRGGTSVARPTHSFQ